jgi:excinuclease ABC subunit A
MAMRPNPISVRGARQNNLRNISVTVPVGAVTLITGVAGAGKSSLAFDVIYAEGYRRYVETFSTYARQFLDRLDRPDAERIDDVLPAVAIERTNQVRTSRSTVGTLTSIDDYLRPLYARAATLHCRGCGLPVERDSPASIFDSLLAAVPGRQVAICFRRRVGTASPGAIRDVVRQAGFFRVLESGRAVRLDDAELTPPDGMVALVVDRVPIEAPRRRRILDSLEATFRYGEGRLEVWADGEEEPRPFSEELHCARCDIRYADATSGLFSFNNPIGACPVCKGFGRVIDIDPDLVVPDPTLSVAQGCVRPFQSAAYEEGQRLLVEFLERRGIPADVAWEDLSPRTRRLIWDGEPASDREVSWQERWLGVRGFFDWLESRRYRRHVRILLSRYRRYVVCPACEGAKLRPEALLFRIGGKTLPEVQHLPISEAQRFLARPLLRAEDPVTGLLLGEIRSRLRFLLEVGLGYLTLSRRSRTLSGGEAQRVTLASALGASLTSTLYVIDEPSVGLHPRDVAPLVGVLRRLAEAGNAVVVVEHDPAFIAVADRVIDLGPGAGRDGGNVVHQGTVAGLLQQRRSVTASYLTGRLRVPRRGQRRQPGRRRLTVRGARENNLKDLTVTVPLGLFVCVTGVSGSGKSTLVDQVLYRNLRRQRRVGVMEPGECDSISGAGDISDVILVDQSPLTRTSRMNAATYLKVLDPLRDAFAATPRARSLRLGRSAFSFNTSAGGCPNCNGSGFERVELQFLPDAYIRCPACDGKRFRPEVLEVRSHGYDIAELLAMPAADVARVFGGDHRVTDALQPLLDIGLGYLSLSQPAPSLSGGEAQRLKLAARLGCARRAERLLFILDEPTAGLHPANTADLVRTLHQLVEAGHSVIVVEHDMDVAAAADWIIDLGPEGGEAGGRLVGEGPPGVISRLNTPTGRALRRSRPSALQVRSAPAPREPHERRRRAIHVVGARQHNLRGIDVRIPYNRIMAVTGVSGSGKSTIAFDVVYAEGRRRFLDCLPAYARQFTRPLPRAEVDLVEGVPPTAALEQRLAAPGGLSTTGTVSEAYHYLRLLFASAGVPHCPRCGAAGEASDAGGIARRIVEQFGGREVLLLAPLVRARKGLHRDVIDQAARQGISRVRIDGALFDVTRPPALDRFKVHDLDAVVAAAVVDGADPLRTRIEDALAMGGGSVIVVPSAGAERAYSTHRACPRCGAELPVADPRLFSWTQRFGACPSCKGSGTSLRARHDEPEPPPCRACGGTRLRPEALAVSIDGRNIADIAALPVSSTVRWALGLGSVRPEVSERLLPELINRLRLFDELGLGYLALTRPMATLSTGEAQRVRIAAQLASTLRGVCYVLDEPTVGLHPREVEALLGALRALRDRENTIVVVEHERRIIRAADQVIDLGPGAGARGGRVVAHGSPRAIEAAGTVTGRWLQGREEQPPWPRRPLEGADRLTIVGARLHNLDGVTVHLPLARLVCITGVSGSGKSTLLRDVVLRALRAKLARRALPRVLEDIRGWRSIDRATEVDERPIGRTPRSVPATYVGVMTRVRDLFARTPEARKRGYGPSRFSFNVPGGRCEGCEGQGRRRVTMPLLPEVYVTCDTCEGRRYNQATLDVTLEGHSIADVLDLTVDEALALLGNFPDVATRLEFLSAIGLGYLRLGQPSPTLSGGEAQRTKLAAEMAATARGRSFYVLDEPTTGLHMADTARLIIVLQGLVDRGDTVVVIEHDLDVIAAADCVIDLGPEGGSGGGQVVAWGTPEEVASTTSSHTAVYLDEHLRRATNPARGTR